MEPTALPSRPCSACPCRFTSSNRLATAVLTNGTDTIPAEAAELGLDAHFNAIFNSATIGFAKPHPRAFQHVLDSMRVPASTVFFTDDSPTNVAEAANLGMITHHYTSIAALTQALRENSIHVGT